MNRKGEDRILEEGEKMNKEKEILVTVYTEDRFLFRKIYLSLLGEATCEYGSSEKDRLSTLILWDTRLGAPKNKKAITIYGKDSRLPSPFSLYAVRELIHQKSEDILTLDRESKICTLRGEKIRLTELEASLLDALMSARGEFVSREELLKAVWGDTREVGIVNVYIHYLREKLEEKGEKVIISSRNQGYKLCAKFQSYGRRGASDTEEKITDTENEKIEENEKTRKGEENAETY